MIGWMGGYLHDCVPLCVIMALFSSSLAVQAYAHELQHNYNIMHAWRGEVEYGDTSCIMWVMRSHVGDEVSCG